MWETNLPSSPTFPELFAEFKVKVSFLALHWSYLAILANAITPARSCSSYNYSCTVYETGINLSLSKLGGVRKIPKRALPQSIMAVITIADKLEF